MKFSLCLCLLLIGLQVHCHHVPGHSDEQEGNGEEHPLEHQHHPLAGQEIEPSSYKKIVDSNAEFLFRLYKHITSDSATQNIFFSPLCISTCFAMLTLGAKDETHHQIFHGLGFNLSDIQENEIHAGFNRIVRTLNQPNNVTQMTLGNALFIEESSKPLPKFLNDVKTLYEAETFSTSFKNSKAAEYEINDYVKNKTNGKISHAVNNLDPHTVMVLLNYIFFKASWKNPFNHELTREADFFVDANTTVKVHMMSREGYYDFFHDDDLLCWVVRLPYNGDFSAWFILPDKGKLKEVEDALVVGLLNKWRTSLKHKKIELRIPKFSISGSYDVKALLQREGVNDVFNDNADLSGITGQRNLKVSKAIHKAVLDVHEGGTEAAAVTVVDITFYALLPPPPILEFNKPFLMFVTNKATRHFVFMAKVHNPTA
ncbi:alpha-1-antitrypsin-like [Eublepharis macularius]|uniref:Alpha-1-antitrypsin-like n=1 Tax=Eublepharis macularius TaxID=481883 RepID=A0AA97KNN2_EUBMA|nr:alpha-1-antitrypsin-like [Eublepharis macularius]XP_054827360.1 alpha-1-antitrypsin-like [Eublepharis macularius]